MRHVIVHYHFYKNAGTSIDRILQDSFSNLWTSCDFDELPLSENIRKCLYVDNKELTRNSVISSDALNEIILYHKDKIAFSSHQLFFPIPHWDVIVHPILFLRHPIDRVVSGFIFNSPDERKGKPLSTKAFSDFIEALFDSPESNAFANFQSVRLANVRRDSANAVSLLTPQQIILNSKKALDRLPFFGLVEYFDQSLARMEAYLKNYFPNIVVNNYRLNSTREDNKTLDERLAGIKKMIGDNSYQFLCDQNEIDLEIYYHALDIFMRKKHVKIRS